MRRLRVWDRVLLALLLAAVIAMVAYAIMDLLKP